MDFKIFRKIIRLKIVLLALLLPLIFSGCSYLNIFSKSEMAKSSPEGLYSRASAEFNNGHYKKAQEYFLRLKEEFPLHDLAILAEVGIADSMYSDKEYSVAENAYSDFVSLHPVNEMFLMPSTSRECAITTRWEISIAIRRKQLKPKGMGKACCALSGK